MCSSDLNRTVADIRHVFTRHGGNLGAGNSVAWMFERKGQIAVDATKTTEDQALEAALDAGADDLTRDGDVFLITTPVNRLHAVHDQLTAKRIPVQSAEAAMIPKSTVKVQGGDAKRLLQLIEALEDAFYHKNVRTTLVLGHARGVILLAAAEWGLAIAQYPPATVKKTVVGAGGAAKAQVGAMVARLLRLRAAPRPADAADGVAVALTCIIRA